MGNSSKNGLNGSSQLVSPQFGGKNNSSTIFDKQLIPQTKFTKQTMDKFVKNLQIISDVVSVHSYKDDFDHKVDDIYSSQDKLKGYQQADDSLQVYQQQKIKPLAQSNFDESQQFAGSNKLVFSSNIDQSQFFKLKHEVKTDEQINVQSSQIDEQDEDDVFSDFINFDWDSIRFQQQDIFNTPFSHRIKQLKQQSFNNFLEINLQEKK